ncbi:serine hydrolase-like protein isoform X3 [Bacillus rossius redtenbacheri]
MDNCGTFNRLIPLLPRSHYYACVDLPSHGLSSRFPPGLPLDFCDLVMSLRRVTDHFGWDRVTLMGHSLGGQVCAVFSAMYPRRVRTLVMLDSLAPYATPLDGYKAYYRHSVEALLKLDVDGEPPSHTYEEALRRMVDKRVDKITVEAARQLLERGLVKNQNGYSFSVDPRMRTLLPFSFGSEGTGLTIPKLIACPQLTVITDYVRHRIASRKEFQNAFKEYSQRGNFTCVEVEGSHDIHNISPEKISGDISQFLVKQTSTL